MKLIDFINEEQSALLKPTSSYMKGVNDYIKKNPGKSHEDFKLLTPNKQNKYLDKYVDEAGCLGKQIKKGKAKKSESKLNEYKYYMVKGPKGFKEKILAGSESDAKTKARHLAYRQGKATVGSSRFSGTSDSDFEIDEGKSPHKKGTKKYKKHMAAMHAESIQLEDVDLSDDMIGTPDEYYDEEERKDAFKDLKDAMDDCSKDYETEGVIDGVCPNCAGSGYQDAEYEVWDDDEDDYVEGNECDGWGNYGCDEGEMENCSWIEIIKHDKRNAERQKAKADYPGDEAVIDQISRAVKQMDDPRQMFQYMQADYPFMGRAQRSSLIAQGMKKAGLTSESITEGKERSIITAAVVDHLIETFGGQNWMIFADTREQLEAKMYDEIETLSVEEVVDPEMEVGGQPIGNFASGRVIDVINSTSAIEKAMEHVEGLDEGTIDQTFATDNIDKHDKKSKPKKDDKQKLELEVLKKLSGIKKVEENPNFLEPLSRNTDNSGAGVPDYIQRGNIRYQFFPNEINADGSKGLWVADGDPKQATKYPANSRVGQALLKQRANALAKTTPSYKAKLKNDIYSEDAEGDSNEAEIAKIIAKALGDSNRWTEMSAQELYAELESIKPDLADTIKDIGRMIYGVRLAENKTKYHDSSECGCDCGKPVCAACGRPHHPKDIKEVTLEDDQDFHEEFGVLGYSIDENDVFEAEYQGRKVKLNKPTRGDVKKFKVYVKDPKTGNVKKVNFGHGGTSAKRKTMRIRKSNPKARKSFRARHNCDNPGPKTKARYWSCRKW